MIEQRRFARAPLTCPLFFYVKNSLERREGIARDISIGGMFVETSTPAAFGADVVVHVRLPGSGDASAIPGVVRWVRDGGMGVQFGLLGAAITHTITEIGRAHEASENA